MDATVEHFGFAALAFSNGAGQRANYNLSGGRFHNGRETSRKAPRNRLGRSSAKTLQSRSCESRKPRQKRQKYANLHRGKIVGCNRRETERRRLCFHSVWTQR